VLLFPAYLARESTLLVAFCLVFACWRRIRLSSVLIGFLALLGGGLVSRHFGQGGPVSVHGLGGGVYILGKLFWSFFKNFLGLPLWSNTLPECNPIWVTTLPTGLHLGAIRRVGVCHADFWGPTRLLLAWFGIFGIGPAFAAILWRKMVSSRALFGRPMWQPETSVEATPAYASETARATERMPGLAIVLRFCIVYGLISILMTPLLGASADRLVEYGWPFYFVVLSWFLSATDDRPGFRSAGVLLLHLATCWLAWFGFRQQSYLYPGLAVVALNGLGYVLLRRARFGTDESILVSY
jgi:hypothetical protein